MAKQNAEYILQSLRAELESCPRNASGSLNGNAVAARVRRCSDAIQGYGYGNVEAYGMAYDVVDEASEKIVGKKHYPVR